MSDQPHQETHVIAKMISLAKCEETEPCVGCGRPTRTAVVSPDGNHHAHVCSPICLAMVEMAKELVSAAEQGEQAPHFQVPVRHPRKKDDLN